VPLPRDARVDSLAPSQGANCTKQTRAAAVTHELGALEQPWQARDGRQRLTALGTALAPALSMLWEEELPGGAHWSAVIRRGVVLRLTAEGDDANVAALFYNREQPIERYNMADTLKAQHIAHLTTGCVCYSDMGRILCSITADTCGWHDPLCGLTDAKQIAARYGATRFQEDRNERFVSGRDAMLVELGKYGLNERDLIANINFFSKVVVDDSGAMHLIPSHSRAGQYVDLRFEMDTIVALHSGPHPLAEGRYAPPAIRLQARRGLPPAADDPCRTRCPENARGFINTERLYSA
jgi:urea carboxylase-associated protein 2